MSYQHYLVMVIEHCPREHKNTYGANVSPGTVFEGKIHDGAPSIYLKAAELVVDLADPTRAWSTASWTERLMIQDFRPLKVKLVVQGDA